MTHLAGLQIAPSARLRFQPLGADDAEALRAVTDHPSVTSAVSFLRSPFSLDDAKALIASANAGDRLFGLWSQQDDTLIGVVGAHLRESDRIEIGYWIGVEHQGQGYATEAAAAVIAGLLGALPDRTIVAECHPANAASRHVLEKLGFQATGKPGVRPGRALFRMDQSFAG